MRESEPGTVYLQPWYIEGEPRDDDEGKAWAS